MKKDLYPSGVRLARARSNPAKIFVQADGGGKTKKTKNVAYTPINNPAIQLEITI